MTERNQEFEKAEDQIKDLDKDQNKVTIPVIQEEVTITKKLVDTVRVNVSKTINESTESYQIPVSAEEIVVKRVPKNEYLDTMPPASRYEGDVMIIPVLKEVAVIEKRIMLVEEIHVSKLKNEKTETVEVVLREEEVNVTRTKLS